MQDVWSSTDGSTHTVTLQGTLAKGKIGKAVDVVDLAAGLNETIDYRATVSLLTRNIEVKGGYDEVYDYISGVGPDLTDYGGTIRTYQAYSEDKEGWDDTMAGYEVLGQYHYPEGTISMLNYVRFRAMGKQVSYT